MPAVVVWERGMQPFAVAQPPLRREVARKLAVLLSCLALTPRQQMLLAAEISVLLATQRFEDAAYAALREKGYSDRSARLTMLAARRTDAMDPRHRAEVQRTFERIMGPHRQSARLAA